MEQQKNTANTLWTLPNLITFFRFICIGLLIYAFCVDRPILALIFFLVAGASDLLDGFIARKYHLITDAGKLLDPLADKLLVISALVCLYLKGYMPLAIPIVIMAKEALMVIGGALLYKTHIKVVSANIFGKIAAAAIFTAVVLCFLHEYVAPADLYFLWGGVALSLAGMAQYAYLNVYKVLRNRKKA